MNIESVKQEFLNAVKNHEIKVIKNEGVNRHIRFSENDSIMYSFDLITWPGYLCITGDCGTYVFRRMNNMFNFFASGASELTIKPEYWGEKLVSICRAGGFKKYSPELFTYRVNDYVSSWCEGLPDEEADELTEEVNDRVLVHAEDGEVYAYSAVQEFEHEGYQFDDFFDGGGTEEYTYHYVWCLFAIVWGIQKLEESNISNG